MSIVLSAVGQGDEKTTSISFTVAIPDATNLIAFVFVSGQRSTNNPDTLEFDYTSATMGGVALTQVANQNSTSSNRFYRTRLYKIKDPRDEGTKPANQTVTVIAERSLVSFSVIVVFASGVVEHKTAEKIVGGNSDMDVSLDIENEAVPSVILAGGMVRDRTDNYGTLNATDDTTELFKIGAGTGQFTSHVGMVGYAEALDIDEYTLGWEWSTGDPSHLIALELVGALETSPAEFHGVDPTIILGDVLVEDVPGTAEFGGSVGEIILGSVPPVQVAGDGNLYFSTAARTMTVLLLATSGDNWVISTDDDAVETLGLTISRRKGYLVPQ